MGYILNMYIFSLSYATAAVQWACNQENLTTVQLQHYLGGTLPLMQCGQKATQTAHNAFRQRERWDWACCECKAECHASQVGRLDVNVAVQMCGCWKLHNNEAGAKEWANGQCECDVHREINIWTMGGGKCNDNNTGHREILVTIWHYHIIKQFSAKWLPH